MLRLLRPESPLLLGRRHW